MTKRNTIKNEFTGTDYLKATGPIRYGMMNDYIFRIVFQENKFALKGLLCALLGLKENQIVALKITNEVKPGISISDKEYRMDIVVELSDGTTVELEMQRANHHNWHYRSLSYLCREFDSLDTGADYTDVKPVYQIGIVNFTPFNDHPEFYAKYQLRNAKDSHLFTDRFNLIVLSLTQIKCATKVDKALGFDKWARLFKSKTWEDIRMVASDNKYMTSAIETAYLSSEDRNIIKIAREREDYLRSEAYKDAQLKKQRSQIVKLKESNASKDATIAEQNATISEQDATIAEQGATISEQDATIAELKARIKELESKS